MEIRSLGGYFSGIFLVAWTFSGMIYSWSMIYIYIDDYRSSHVDWWTRDEWWNFDIFFDLRIVISYVQLETRISNGQVQGLNVPQTYHKTSTSTIDNMHLYKCSCCINFHFQILKVGFNTKNCPTLTQTKVSPRSSVHLLVIFMKLFQLLLQGHSSAREVGNTLMGSEIRSLRFVMVFRCSGLRNHLWFWEKNQGTWEIMWKIQVFCRIKEIKETLKYLELDKHAWDSEAQLLDFTGYLILRHIPTCSKFLATASHTPIQMPSFQASITDRSAEAKEMPHSRVVLKILTLGTGVDRA